VYDHHVRALTEKINAFQHELGDQVRSTLHIHLDEHRCLEVIILRGRSDELQRVAERLLATRGVSHGGLEIVTDDPGHGHDHAHAHAHAHAHDHDHAPRRRARASRR
jgi:CopG family nickel-responsive transcriptional regulator